MNEDDIKRIIRNSLESVIVNVDIGTGQVTMDTTGIQLLNPMDKPKEPKAE